MLNIRNSSIIEIPTVNPISILQEYYYSRKLSDKSITTENKELYASVECPLIILATIADNLKFVSELLKNTDLQTTGHIGLSKRRKNSIISNIFGAACFYGSAKVAFNLISDNISKIFIKY
jgi:hypothetical protein